MRRLDALGVAERGESADFVVVLLAGAEAAEGEAVLRDVHDGAAAGCRAVEDLASVGAVVAEVRERERPLSCVDVVNGVVDAAVPEDRQDGAEGLLVGEVMSSVTPSTMVGTRVCGRRAASPGRCPTSMIRAACARASSIRPVRIFYCLSLPSMIEV
jgi:hypothetical protein